MHDFIYKDYALTIDENDSDERKTPKKNKEKIPVWLPSHSPIYNMEADSFLVSEKTENKPDLPLANGTKETQGGAR